MPAADPEIARGVARVQREFARREADVGLDQRRIETHTVRSRLDVGAGLSKDRARPAVQKVDSDFLQHGQGGLMDRLKFVARHEFERRKRQLRLGRRPGGGRGGTLGPAPAAASRFLRLDFGGHTDLSEGGALNDLVPLGGRLEDDASAEADPLVRLTAAATPATRQNCVGA